MIPPRVGRHVVLWMREGTMEGSTPSIDGIVQVTLSDGPGILVVYMPIKQTELRLDAWRKVCLHTLYSRVTSDIDTVKSVSGLVITSFQQNLAHKVF